MDEEEREDQKEELPYPGLSAFVAVAVREAQKACALKNVELKKMTISAKVLGLDGPCKSSYVYVANRWHFEYVKPGASELASTITMEIEFPKPERSDDD